MTPVPFLCYGSGMTLSTDIYLNTTHTPQEVFEVVNALLGIPETRKSGSRESVYSPGTMSLSNDPGQGFPAWVSLSYKADGSLLSEGMEACTDYCDEGDEDDEPYHSHTPTHNIVVNLDTGYAYNENNMGCADLHASIIVGLLNTYGEDLHWKNEFNGDKNKNLEGIETFISNSNEMKSWFSDVINTMNKGLL